MPPIQPIDVQAIVATSLGILVVLIPIAGLTLRFSVKPLLTLMAQIRGEVRAGTNEATVEKLAALERRVLELEQQARIQSRGQLAAVSELPLSAPTSPRVSERY